MEQSHAAAANADSVEAIHFEQVQQREDVQRALPMSELFRRIRRTPVPAQIRDNDTVLSGKIHNDRLPNLAGRFESLQQNKRPAFAINLEIHLHAVDIGKPTFGLRLYRGLERRLRWRLERRLGRSLIRGELRLAGRAPGESQENRRHHEPKSETFRNWNKVLHNMIRR
jgi:hypothetical protein